VDREPGRFIQYQQLFILIIDVFEYPAGAAFSYRGAGRA
jgi:hypothetical protein